eukprot:m.348463 g.348463  ORF g.348463 m.348463 type:complete len:308 (-) comp37417_c0_seq1:47-970(-)
MVLMMHSGTEESQGGHNCSQHINLDFDVESELSSMDTSEADGACNIAAAVEDIMKTIPESTTLPELPLMHLTRNEMRSSGGKYPRQHIKKEMASRELAGKRAPFCSPCRRLVMDRVGAHMVSYPHPAVSEAAGALCISSISLGYTSERYKVRKLSQEWCEHCRTDPEHSRSAQDRFNRLWNCDVVRARLLGDWYKTIRSIDTVIHEHGEHLKALLSTTFLNQQDLIATTGKIEALAKERAQLKSLTRRIDRIRTHSQEVYADGILREAAKVLRDSKRSNIQLLVHSIFSYKEIDTGPYRGLFPSPVQ